MSRVIIHIGYPRAGSTFLQNWFQQHPLINYAYNKIGGFSSAHELCAYAQKNQSIHEYFAFSSEDFALWRGDMNIVGLRYTPYNISSYQENLCHALYRLFPTGKVLIVTRGFASVIRSVHAHYLASGGVLSFSKFQQENGEMLSAFFNYSRILTLYRNAFGADNVIIMPYELLNENPENFICELEAELGIATHFFLSKDKVNMSFDGTLLEAYRKFSAFLFKLLIPFPYRMQYGIYGFYIYLLFTFKPFPPIKLIHRMMRTRVPEPVEEQTLKYFSGMGEMLKQEKLFQPYLKEYLE
ncbi:MAG: sulfotransferase [Chitinophagales bacterium]|nr:sulfotransferase [Chitinophagales bacterium]